MNDTPETLPKRRRASGKRSKPDVSVAPVVVSEPAVQAILTQALHPDPALADAVAGERGEDLATPVVEGEASTAKGRGGRRTPRRKTAPSTRTKQGVGAVEPAHGVTVAVAAPVAEAMAAAEPVLPAAPHAHDADAHAIDTAEGDGVEGGGDVGDSGDGPSSDAAYGGAGEDPAPPDDATPSPPPQGAAPPSNGHAPATQHPHEPGHHWVYLAFVVFVLALAFGGWGVWTTFFASGRSDAQDVSALRARSDKLNQEVSTLRRSDQISREANRDLERTLAERDEEIAGLRADIAFYERFVGATGQRRGLSVHDLDLQLQTSDTWHFVATLTQNLNRGAVNTGRLTISVEGTRDDRLERLSWSSLRKLNNAPGVEYSFKYFQQVEGELLLPPGFKPLRVAVRLVPAGGAAVEQSFSWTDTVKANR